MKANEFFESIYFKQACKQNLKHMKNLMLFEKDNEQNFLKNQNMNSLQMKLF